MAKLSDVIRRGTRGAQPAASAVAVGTLYYVTDESLLERSTGAAWESYSNTASGAPSDATYATFSVNGSLSAEVNIAAKKFVMAEADGNFSAEVVRQWLANYYNDTYPGSANAMDDEFDDGSGFSGAVNGLNARWTWRNQSTSTATFSKAGWLTLSPPAASAVAWRGIEQTVPVGDYTVEAKFSLEGRLVDNAQGGLAVIDSVNGDLYTFVLQYGNTLGRALKQERWNSVTSFNSTQINAPFYGTSVYMRLVYVSGTTTFEWWYSTDGVGWARLNSFTDAVVHTRVGIFVSDHTNTTTTKLHCDYFRRTA